MKAIRSMAQVILRCKTCYCANLPTQGSALRHLLQLQDQLGRATSLHQLPPHGLSPVETPAIWRGEGREKEKNYKEEQTCVEVLHTHHHNLGSGMHYAAPPVTITVNLDYYQNLTFLGESKEHAHKRRHAEIFESKR